MKDLSAHQRYAFVLGAIFLMLLITLAIAPVDRKDWAKDMGMATLGALVAMLVTAGLNIYLQRDFAREWVDSLRVKESLPLGEDEIRRLWKDRSEKKD